MSFFRKRKGREGKTRVVVIRGTARELCLRWYIRRRATTARERAYYMLSPGSYITGKEGIGVFLRRG